MRVLGFVSDPLVVGVRVMIPAAVGVIKKFGGAEELLKESMIEVVRPPPEGVIVIIPE